MVPHDLQSQGSDALFFYFPKNWASIVTYIQANTNTHEGIKSNP